MTVTVQNFSLIGGAGAPLVKSFSDTFTRANDSLGLGPNWLIVSKQPATATSALCQLLGNTMTLTNTAVGGFNVGFYIIPRLIINGLFGISQFAQAKLNADNSAGGNQARAGVACMMTESDGYIFEPNIDTTNFLLRRANLAGTVIAGPFGTSAINDVLRLECTITPTGNTLVCKQNGTTINTSTDNNLIQVGFPGFHWAGMSNTITQSWINFSCGAL
jgi:hypothetical protein